MIETTDYLRPANAHDLNKEKTNTIIKAHDLTMVDKFKRHKTQALLLALPDKFIQHIDSVKLLHMLE